MTQPSNAIEVTHLTRQFRRKCAVDDVTLNVPRGCVFGLLGENGAGKTTLIKHLLGALKAKSGQVRVLGFDPVADCVNMLSRIGYLSEDRIMPMWMRVHELISFMRAFYPRWDNSFAEELRDIFRLDPETKVKSLSRGERAKAGLLIALAHRPELLILDEPSSGLDVIVRRDILAAIMRNVAEEGRTVFFSSHLLDEVERACDYIAMMARGKLILADTLDNIRESHHRITIRFESTHEATPNVDGALTCFGTGRDWTVICNGERERVIHFAQKANAAIVDERAPTLEEIFVARTKAATNAG